MVARRPKKSDFDVTVSASLAPADFSENRDLEPTDRGCDAFDDRCELLERAEGGLLSSWNLVWSNSIDLTV